MVNRRAAHSRAAITRTGADNRVTQELQPWQPLLLTITSKNSGPASPSSLFHWPPMASPIHTSPVGSPQQEGRAESLQRCLQSGELRSAAALIQTGPHWAGTASSEDGINLSAAHSLVGRGLVSICIFCLSAPISPGTLPLLSPCLGSPPAGSCSDPAPRAGGLHLCLLLTDSCNKCTARQ